MNDFDWEDMGIAGGMAEEFAEEEMERLRIEKEEELERIKIEKEEELENLKNERDIDDWGDNCSEEFYDDEC